MDEKTVRALNAINRSFYGASAAEFSQTRRDPWPGWERLPPLIEEHLPDRALGVLDVACGNGRFGAYLADALPARRGRLRYFGLDASEPLLAAARARRLPFAEVVTQLGDLVEAPLEPLLAGHAFSVIAVFGVLHHVPSERLRQQLLRTLAAHLEPGGLLALAVWRFAAFERFRTRLRSWEEFNRAAREPIDVSQLESGDHLLPWGDGGRAVRYCHAMSDEEMRRLPEAARLRVVASYTADGRDDGLNRYFIFRLVEGS
jgi:SAM-dependent methyltransferase